MAEWLRRWTQGRVGHGKTLVRFLVEVDSEGNCVGQQREKGNSDSFCTVAMIK